MPFLAGLAPIFTAIAAAGSLAATGYELANQPSSSSTTSSTTAAQTAAQQAQTAAQQKAAFLAAQPNVQAQTGGALSSLGLNTATATAAGVPSDLNSIAKYLGLSSGTSSGSSSSVSGGTTPTTVTPGQQANPLDLETLSDLLSKAV